MKTCTRRTFLISSATAAAAASAIHLPAGLFSAQVGPALPLPSYLKGYKRLYRGDPRGAARQWFRDARFGLFLHYGLYSLESRHEWLQFREKIPVAQYARLKDRFTAEKFDAGAITDLALAARMRYVNITTRHHDSFCLFATKQTDFNSVNSPARRDLIGELAEACQKKGLGLCLYYSHGRDWRHPHAPNNDRWGGSARPGYAPPEPSYATGAEHDLRKYVDFMTAQITELLTNYGPIAAIWLDGIGTPLSDKTKTPCPQPPRQPGNAPEFRCQELYDLIHRLQPQVLVSYKQGLLGSEDFFAPEHKAVAFGGDKPMEICSTLQEGSWGYHEQKRHVTTDEAWAKLAAARAARANLLLNTGPLPDGSIPPQHARVLRAIGERIRRSGFPSDTKAL
ncbi:MAG TPA: alpha-L-fucosidase [Candidatus Paceibacterota bacterium]|nr:alpha-L-fucosidase [Verrucomicrobiota bacterium]HSA11455.1 alpha-L-fucosidase [Candidatus Paceibacterota bacterium]